MSGFVKLYGSILDSSVWAEPAPTRIVWITLLAMADADGCVMASVGGLARRAAVTRDEADAALATFLAPDPDDRSGVEDGRRIREIDRGWQVINHGHYRDLRTEKQVQNAERQRRFRESQSVTSNASNAESNDSNAGNGCNAQISDPDRDRDRDRDRESEQTFSAPQSGSGKRFSSDPSKARSKKTRSPEEQVRIEIVKDHWIAEFTSVRCIPPHWVRRDEVASANLLQVFEWDPDRVCEIIDRALSDEFRGQSVTLQQIANDPTAFAVAPAEGHKPKPNPKSDDIKWL